MRLLINKTLIGYFLLTALLLGTLGWTNPVWAQTPTPGKPVTIYLFWGDGCPHCAKAKLFFESLQNQYPSMVLRDFEIYYNQENQLLLNSFVQKYGIQQLAVPTIFIGSYYLQGYSEEYDQEIRGLIEQCIENGCADSGVDITFPHIVLTPTENIYPQSSTPSISNISPTLEPPNPTQQTANLSTSINQTHTLEIPFIGTVDLGVQSNVLSTVLIAFVDGFNPCSMWVLSMLLALTIHTGSRKKVLLIGLIFLTVTAAIYALFITGLFSVLKVVSFLGWIQVIIALLALFFAVVNIKDYFWYKEGISFTIADEKKPGIYQRMRKLLDVSQTFWGLAGATIVLAAGVSLVEFSCTAGFPVLWTNLLISQKVTPLPFILLLLLYLFIYQLDEIVIFFTAVHTLKSSKLEEKHGRILKLIGGMLMLTLAIVMLINPGLMNNLSSSLIIFGIAFLSTLLVLLIHRIILPKFGVRIGTEIKNKKISNISSRQ